MLYVTLTRAKRLLIAPDGSALYELRDPNFLSLARWDALDLPALFTSAPVGDDADLPVTKDSADHAPKLFRENKRRLGQAAAISRQIPRRILPSGLVHNAEKSSAGLDTPPDGEDDRLRDSEDAVLRDGDGEDLLAGIGGIDYGNWWHSTMQHYPWAATDPAAQTQYLQEQRARINGAADWTARATAELALLADGAAHREFLERGQVFLPEMPFSSPA